MVIYYTTCKCLNLCLSKIGTKLEEMASLNGTALRNQSQIHNTTEPVKSKECNDTIL